MASTSRAEAAGRALIECWSAKDSARIATLLHEDAVLTGPLVPTGRAVGAQAIREFLEAENADPSRLPDEHRDSYEFMARGRARIVGVVTSDTSAAFEVRVTAAGRREVPAAMFIELDPVVGSIARVALYLDPRPGA